MSIFPASMFPNACDLARIAYGRDASYGRTETPAVFASGVACTVQRLDPQERYGYHAIESDADVFVGFMADPGLAVHDQITQVDRTPNRTFVVVEVEDECELGQIWGAYCKSVE